MKKHVISLIVILFSGIYASAQETSVAASVEKNISGIQLGYLGIDLYSELKLTPEVALRGEVSYYGEFYHSAFSSKPYYTFVPTVGIQPKYYFNLKKRAEQGKDVSYNAASYLSLQVKYLPSYLAVSNQDLVKANIIGFVPTFGLRRNIGNNFHFEGHFGYGLAVSFAEEGRLGQLTDLSFKIGYHF